MYCLHISEGVIHVCCAFHNVINLFFVMLFKASRASMMAMQTRLGQTEADPKLTEAELLASKKSVAACNSEIERLKAVVNSLEEDLSKRSQQNSQIVSEASEEKVMLQQRIEELEGLIAAAGSIASYEICIFNEFTKMSSMSFI